jgi:ribosomal protein S18 acetylase RimI-like enzyme
MLLVRRLGGEEWVEYRDVRLRALADSPDAFGSTYEDALRRPDADWRGRVSSSAESRHELPLVLADGDRFMGLAWGFIAPEEPEAAHVFQMWVAPEVRGRGYGAALLAEIVRWAREAGAVRAVLRVTCGNDPAERLYERAGFRTVGEPEPLRPGAVLRSQRMSLDLRPSGT